MRNEGRSESRLYSLPDAAQQLGGVSIWTLRKHLQQSHITAVKLGRRVFISQEEIDRITREGLPSVGA